MGLSRDFPGKEIIYGAFSFVSTLFVDWNISSITSPPYASTQNPPTQPFVTDSESDQITFRDKPLAKTVLGVESYAPKVHVLKF